MRRLIKNRLSVTCDDVDFTALHELEFYVRQFRSFFQYTPAVVDAHTLLVEIPQSDAAQLDTATVYMQFAATDADGNVVASDIIETSVDGFLKEAGYGD